MFRDRDIVDMRIIWQLKGFALEEVIAQSRCVHSSCSTPKSLPPAPNLGGWTKGAIKRGQENLLAHAQSTIWY